MNVLESQQSGLGWTDRKIAVVLWTVLFCYYAIQVLPTSSNGDVWMYACQASAPEPYLNRTLAFTHTDVPYGNIHLAHSIVLWIVYYVLPESLQRSIVPSGVVSAFFGALAIALSYLFTRSLRLSAASSLTIAVTYALVPSFWYHCLIGEVYTFQLASLFGFFVLLAGGYRVLSTLALVLALLVTPLSAFLLGGVLLLPNFRRRWLEIGLILTVGLVLYFALVLGISPGIFRTGHSIVEESKTALGDLAERSARLMFITGVNLVSVFVLLLARDGAYLRKLRSLRPLALGLFMLAAPLQLWFISSRTQPFSEMGSQQLAYLWVLTVVAGFLMRPFQLKSASLYVYLVCSVAMTWIFWIWPSEEVAQGYEEAARWSLQHLPEEVTVIGHFEPGLPLTIRRFNWNQENIRHHFINTPEPSRTALRRYGLPEYLIIEGKQFHPSLRAFLRPFFPRMTTPRWKIYDVLSPANATQLYENEAVVLYRWSMTDR